MKILKGLDFLGGRGWLFCCVLVGFFFFKYENQTFRILFLHRFWLSES